MAASRLNEPLLLLAVPYLEVTGLVFIGVNIRALFIEVVVEFRRWHSFVPLQDIHKTIVIHVMQLAALIQRDTYVITITDVVVVNQR